MLLKAYMDSCPDSLIYIGLAFVHCMQLLQSGLAFGWYVLLQFKSLISSYTLPMSH